MSTHTIKGEQARLIPVIPDSCREQKTTSVLLAAMRSVLELRQALLGSINVRVGKTSTLDARTEIEFVENGIPVKKSRQEDRPDGLLILKTGNREWRALIEAKVGNKDIEEEQLLRYLSLAKQHNIDAVITISNQLCAIPSHHPIRVPKRATTKVGLYHWSWSHIKTQCHLLIENEDIEDSDQVFILNEVMRYFESDRSGITSFDQMNEEWSELINSVKNGTTLNKTSDEVNNTVVAWQQEQKDLCLILSNQTGTHVSLRLKPAYRTDPMARIKDDAELLIKSHLLQSSVIINDAAADVNIECDLKSRTISVYMRLQAPKDKKSTKARVNWLLRQLKQTESAGFSIKAIRPGKAQDTIKPLEHLREHPELIESENGNTTATIFDIIYSIDLAGRFSGRKVFIDELEKAVLHFYVQAGQSLKAWVAPAPKIKKEAEPDELQEHVELD